ncbi:hypothetical protein B0O99DRAFT_614754 [Bisporella sp. PMI_857]|nr:hypothetical protein B0O99DRAFT_614754 [Bisporella sp. PMI_857]
METPVSCHLSVVCLDETPEFENLNYVLGDASLTFTIMVDKRQFGGHQNLRSCSHMPVK